MSEGFCGIQRRSLSWRSKDDRVQVPKNIASGYGSGYSRAICLFRIGRVYRILAAIDSSNDRVDEGSPRWIETSLLGCFATKRIERVPAGNMTRGRIAEIEWKESTRKRGKYSMNDSCNAACNIVALEVSNLKLFYLILFLRWMNQSVHLNVS